jgi:hypothetical protein
MSKNTMARFLDAFGFGIFAAGLCVLAAEITFAVAGILEHVWDHGGFVVIPAVVGVLAARQYHAERRRKAVAACVVLLAALLTGCATHPLPLPPLTEGPAVRDAAGARAADATGGDALVRADCEAAVAWAGCCAPAHVRQLLLRVLTHPERCEP